MAKIVIVGDGPAGLSAALFLAKRDHETHVYGQDDTPMHYAHLHNYLGAPDIGGTQFQQRARKQVRERGAHLHEAEVTAISTSGGHLSVTADGEVEDADYVIVAGGQTSRSLLEEVGADVGEEGAVVDSQQRTTVDRVYAVGRVVRPQRSQAITSAGAGAIAALDVLAREQGGSVVDWDTPKD